MGPGIYEITYDASNAGDPHITTIDGTRYDFQAAGEFVVLRHADGSEIQTRQVPMATTGTLADPNGLAVCVAINSAVAARVGKRRVTYQPNLSGLPDPSGLQLRVDGALTALGPGGLDLGGGGRITKTFAPGGLELDFPDRSTLFVTSGWLADQGKWYVFLDFSPTRAGAGLMGATAPDSWLPALPDGASMGPMPRLVHDRYVALYQTFADAWRVTNETSLFDYAPGTSTDTFTDRAWPPERPPCDVPGSTPIEPVSEHVARQACQSVNGQSANCIYDVMVTGNPGFATTYALAQTLLANRRTESRDLTNRETEPASNSRTLVLILSALLLIAVILLLIVVLRRRAVPA